MKSFSNWTQEEVEEEFSLHLQYDIPLLEDWLAMDMEISNDEQTSPQKLSQKLRTWIYRWNKEELKISFVAFLLDMVDFNKDTYRVVMERELSVAYAQDKKLSDKIDFCVATGSQTLKQPLFFINEYKREQHSSNDPLGQLLAELVAAQFMNEQEQPLYGAYIVGRHWHFVVLTGKVYSVSLAYNATKHEIFDIYRILWNTKKIIEKII
ncbi:MAG: hypothetical protein AAF639_25895 [Chloroflexota bacterium]